VSHLHHNGIGTSVDIRRSEAEKAKIGADEVILAAVVIDEPITMVTAVVFDRQTLKAIKQVWTA